MQFEQVSAFDRLPDFSYNVLDNDGKIYAKIDWLTVIFNDCCLNDVLSWLNLSDCVTDFCLSCYEICRGYDQLFRFNYNNVILETSSFNFYNQNFDVSIFDVIVPKIRLELSGTALDYLRSIGINMDTYRFTVPKLPEGGCYHFTRCDWAFDFINYKPEFISCLIDHIYTHKLPSERVPLASTRGAISCKVVSVGQRTVYLGSPQSDRMLRIYDKRMQYINLTTQTYTKANPYADPDSWFRIEWQTRNKFAHNLVLGVDDQGRAADFKSILKEIFVRYAFADGTVDNHNISRPVVDFWNDLFDWEDIERRFIQNAKYVEPLTPEEQVTIRFKRCIADFMLHYSRVGRDQVEQECNAFLRAIEALDPSSRRRYQTFYNRLNSCSSVKVTSDSHGLFNCFGRAAFRW